MYKAIIQHVEKTEDEIRVKVEFTDGKDSFGKDYSFVSMVDINTGFEFTIKMELKRINDLSDGFATLKAREGEEIQDKL